MKSATCVPWRRVGSPRSHAPPRRAGASFSASRVVVATSTRRSSTTSIRRLRAFDHRLRRRGHAATRSSVIRARRTPSASRAPTFANGPRVKDERIARCTAAAARRYEGQRVLGLNSGSAESLREGRALTHAPRPTEMLNSCEAVRRRAVSPTVAGATRGQSTRTVATPRLRSSCSRSPSR